MSSPTSGAARAEALFVRRRYFPERRVVLVSLELEAVSDYALEPLRLFSRHGIRMLSCIVQSHPNRGSVHASLFLDLTDSSTDPAELLVELRAIPHVRRAELLDLPLTHGEARLVVFTLREVHSLFSMLRELGAGGEAIMYHMGLRAGEALAESLSRCFESGRRALEYLLLYHESLGHGRFELERYVDRAYCRVVVRELMECLGVGSERPNSQLFRGLLAGFLSKIWGEKVRVVESKCIARGDPYCEFEATVA